MPAFSKPVPPSAAIDTTKTVRKRTLNPKLTSEDNVHADAVKRRKLEHAKSGNSIATMSSTSSTTKQAKATTKPKAKSLQASVDC
jgi:hypothetical protein